MEVMVASSGGLRSWVLLLTFAAFFVGGSRSVSTMDASFRVGKSTDLNLRRDNVAGSSEEEVLTIPMHGILRNGIYTVEVEIAGSIYRLLLMSQSSLLIVMTDKCRDCGKNTQLYTLGNRTLPCTTSSSKIGAELIANEKDGDKSDTDKELVCGDGMDICSAELCPFGECTSGGSNVCCYEHSCAWQYEIIEGKDIVSGVIARDSVKLSGVDGLDKESSMEASGVALSGTVEQKGLVENGSFFHGLFDGFWGLSAGRKGCSPTCTKSYLDELADQGALTSPSFAMCVNDFGGLFNVGGINEKLVGGKFSYVQYKESDEGDYIINTTKIKVGDQIVTGKDNVVMPTSYDFTSPFTYFKPSLLKAIRDQMKKTMCDDVPYICTESEDGVTNTIFQSLVCAPYTEAHLKFFPTIELTTAEGDLIVIGAEQYMMQTVDAKTMNAVWCFMQSENKGDDGFEIILGLTHMLHKYVFFDRRKKQIGYAPSKDCVGGCLAMKSCTECTKSASCSWCKNVCLQTSDFFSDCALDQSDCKESTGNGGAQGSEPDTGGDEGSEPDAGGDEGSEPDDSKDGDGGGLSAGGGGGTDRPEAALSKTLLLLLGIFGGVLGAGMMLLAAVLIRRSTGGRRFEHVSTEDNGYVGRVNGEVDNDSEEEGLFR